MKKKKKAVKLEKNLIEKKKEKDEILSLDKELCGDAHQTEG